MSTGLWIALVAVVVAVAFGAYRALTDGRFRGTRAVGGADAPGGSDAAAGDPDASDPAASGPAAPVAAASAGEPGETTWTSLAEAAGVAPGERATLVQFSSAFCAPCRTTRRVLADVAEAVPGVVHVDIDAEEHLDVVRRLGILRTPTTIVLDAAGHEVARAAGAPRKEQVLSALPAADLQGDLES
ncbi:thioredoxin family protein [Nocardioides sp. DS6]|uniref:Thioredoxin family protein n=1 Tax=Nocardioides eburneus TaxID=3231482 RepID=A0ABV3SW45_9ACTN